MTGADLKLSGTRADFDTSPGGARPADRVDGVHRQGRRQVPGDHPRRVAARQDPQPAAALRDRARPRDPHLAADRLHGRIARRAASAAVARRSPGSSRSTRRRRSRSSCRPARSRSSSSRSTRPNISATLGKDSLQEAKVAALVGLLAVALFLLLFYRFLGLVAVLGLFVYAALLYAAVLLFNVTLTLPGIAGLVLTLGVAADANIVIFERIKEEARAGRSVRAAISTGYTKGFATIVDANVVTMITALVLFAVATASVRGFALMLLVGTAISMLTAVLATRAFLAVLAGFKVLDNTRLIGTSGPRHPVLAEDRLHRAPERRGSRSRRPSSLISIGAIAVKGLNLGIDFKGGTQISFKTPAPVSLEQVRAEAAGDRSVERRHPGSRPRHGRQLPELPDPHRDAHAGGQRAAARRVSRRRSARRRSARRTSRRASAGRSPRARSSRSSSRCS